MLHVVMPAYNAGPYLADAITSVLTQTHRAFRLVICDDGSRDATLQIARSFERADARVRVVTHANCGIANTMNRALADLPSDADDWVACMHGDDVMLPTRLERQLHFVRQHPDLAVVSSLVQYISADGRSLGFSRSPLLTLADVDRHLRSNGVVAFPHPAVMLRRSAVVAAGGYRQEFWPAEDTELWNRLVRRGHRVLVQPEVLLQYRLHGRNASMSRIGLMIDKLLWMEQCLDAQSAGRAEPGWSDYLASQGAGPALRRLNALRRRQGKILYQMALNNYSMHQLAPSLLNFISALLLDPAVPLQRLLSRLPGLRRTPAQ